MKYIFFSTFNDFTHSVIFTDITDPEIAYQKHKQLKTVFPEQNWDYSNANWTLDISVLKYFKVKRVS
mgnify:CR=1 FL=1